MKINQLEHISIETKSIETLAQWYCTVLGLVKGARPAFNNQGYWLYANNTPIVHLIASSHVAHHSNTGINHFACSASGLSSFLELLQQQSVTYKTSRVPELKTLQIDIWDPDGNRLHIDFSPEEADACSL